MPPEHSVTPRRAGEDRPLVDPETGETAPLSPQQRYLDRLRGDPERYRKFIEGTWDLAEPDDAA